MYPWHFSILKDILDPRFSISIQLSTQQGNMICNFVAVYTIHLKKRKKFKNVTGNHDQ